MTQPEIRFNGFSDEWVEKKLGDLYIFSKGKGIPKQSLSEDEFQQKGVPYGDLFTKYGQVIKSVSTYTQDRNGPVSTGSEILIPASSTVPLGPAQVTSIVIPDVRLGGDIIIGSPINKRVNNTFVAISTTSNRYKMYRFISGSTISHISSKGVAQIPISIPSLPEQQKIGALFSKYDAIIALREQKLEELNALKKGMLQQMFPKNGAKVPELRFEGFTDDWVERKLGNELTLLKDGTHGSHQNVLEGPFLLSAKNIKNGKVIIDEITDRKISVEEYNSIHKKFSLEKGDVLLTIVGSIGETAIIENPMGITFQRSVAYLRPSHTLLSQFLFTTINGQKFQMELKKRQVVSAQPGVYLGDLSIIPVLIPSLNEQQKIGQLFKHLDARISNEQTKIEQLKAQKQGLLERML